MVQKEVLEAALSRRAAEERNKQALMIVPRNRLEGEEKQVNHQVAQPKVLGSTLSRMAVGQKNEKALMMVLDTEVGCQQLVQLESVEEGKQVAT